MLDRFSYRTDELTHPTTHEEDADITTTDHTFTHLPRALDVVVTDDAGGTLKYRLPGDANTVTRTQSFGSSVYGWAHRVAVIVMTGSQHVQVKGRW